MAPKDADMPSHQTLGDDIDKIAKHLTHLRRDIEKLTGSIRQTGVHQAERVQDAATEAVTAVEDAVRRNPVQAVGIAAGVGLLLGIILRR